MNEFIFLYITFSSKHSAIELAKKCLTKKMIACANIIPEVISIYNWENNIEQNNEVIAIFKTTKNKQQELANFIKEHHDYDCPCIASLETEILNKDFGTWIKNCVM